jgi:predicted nucleic acid-binding protein
MEQYLIDTNIVSDYLSASFSTDAITFLDNVIDAIPNLSIITQIELLCWKTDINIENNVKNFIADSIVLNISADVISKCVDIRKNKKAKTHDAIIAAIALAYGYTLVTNNEKDFVTITDLKIINPWKI